LDVRLLWHYFVLLHVAYARVAAGKESSRFTKRSCTAWQKSETGINFFLEFWSYLHKVFGVICTRFPKRWTLAHPQADVLCNIYFSNNFLALHHTSVQRRDLPKLCFRNEVAALQ